MYHQIPMVDLILASGKRYEHRQYMQAISSFVGKMHSTIFSFHIGKVRPVHDWFNHHENFMNIQLCEGPLVDFYSPAETIHANPTDTGMFLGVACRKDPGGPETLGPGPGQDARDVSSRFLWPVFLNGESMHSLTFEDPEFISNDERYARPNQYDMFVVVEYKECVAVNTYVTRSYLALNPVCWKQLFHVVGPV